ncbi:MAG TPA: AraC family ligand binding domain-containing protein [Gemmatimonadaceae bacterium]
MKSYDPGAAAKTAVAPPTPRPATALIHDAPGARLVVFRIEPGQQVAPHTSASTVILSIVSGSGTVLGAEGERSVRAGELVVYEPHELHGMRALDEQLVIAAAITPRPGTAA